MSLTVNAKETNRIISFEAGKELGGLVRFEFSAAEQWFEEDTPIHVHPKDPFKRIDTVQSTRKIEVEVGGVKVASTPFSVHLFETGLPTRYYLPQSCIDQSVLRPSKTRSLCPYKGEAEYFDVVADGQEYKDVVWYYSRPLPESIAVLGLCCFYNEKVDIWIDGVKQERPKTLFG